MTLRNEFNIENTKRKETRMGASESTPVQSRPIQNIADV
jgi:hypothetical protein